MRMRFLSIWLMGWLAASGQDPRGFIRGTVTHSSGAVVPGARVKAVSNETGVTVPAVTNESGIYGIPYLIPGFYKLAIEQTGFKTYTRDKIEVRVSETVEVPVALEVGSMTETVDVTAESPVLETASASLGQVIDQRRISELPQRGANTTNLRLRKPMAPEATSDTISLRSCQF